jgi:GR25 family glycosyltransferase involved in LPS biosynthesis
MQNLWNDIDVRIVHPKSGYEKQERHMITEMNKHDIPFKFQLRGDQEELTSELLNHYFIPGITYSKGSLSCTIKHFQIYEEFIQSPKNFLLVFENDIFLSNNFNNSLEAIVNEIKSRELSTFLISLENSCMRFPSYWQTKANQLLYKAKDGRAAGAYLIDKAAAIAMIQYLQHKKCETNVDWWHNQIATKQIISIYWAHPTIAEQGSHNGKLSGEISTHKNSFFRQLAWYGHKFFRTYIKRLFNESRILPS